MHRFRLRLDAKPAELTLVIALREYAMDLAQDLPAILPKDLEREVSRHTSERTDGADALRILFPHGLHGWDITVAGSDLFIVNDGEMGNVRTVALILHHFAPAMRRHLYGCGRRCEHPDYRERFAHNTLMIQGYRGEGEGKSHQQPRGEDDI